MVGPSWVVLLNSSWNGNLDQIICLRNFINHSFLALLTLLIWSLAQWDKSPSAILTLLTKNFRAAIRKQLKLNFFRKKKCSDDKLINRLNFSDTDRVKEGGDKNFVTLAAVRLRNKALVVTFCPPSPPSEKMHFLIQTGLNGWGKSKGDCRRWRHN